MRMILSQSSLSVFRNGIGRSQPAVLTRTQIGPSSASTCATARSTEARSPTSTAQVVIADFGASFAVSCPASGLISKIATLQPSSASRRVMARPMPWPPPVTIATLPDKPLKVSLPCFATHWPTVLFGEANWRPADQSRSTALGQRETTLREHLASNDRFHDFNRSARDLDNPGVDIGAGDRIFTHISPPSEKLQAFIDGFAMKFGGKHLGHRGVHRIQLSLHEKRNTFIGKNAGDGRLGFQIGKLELGILKICKLLTEHASIRRV